MMEKFDENMWRAKDLADYIVRKCEKDNCQINNFYLQKILYCIQRDSVKTHGKIAFFDDFEAWACGPVIPNVYYEYCKFAVNKIWTMDTRNFQFENEAFKKVVDSIIEGKRTLESWELHNETIKKNGAWEKVFDKGNGNKKIIPVDFIIKCE